MPGKERVQEFVAMVRRGAFVEALETFYDADASMQENLDPPRRGLSVLIAAERAVLAAHRSVQARPVEMLLIDGPRVVINWVFDFTAHDGTQTIFDEIAVQHWEGEKIVRERFYYDPAQLRPAGGAAA